jgi:hypothetical protein
MNKAAQDRLCLDCHKEVSADVARHEGYHGRIRIETCRACHTEHKGRGAHIVQLDTQHFDHLLTDFRLDGKHTSTACSACHRSGTKYRAAPGSCVECHRKDDIHKAGLGEKCAECHSTKSWKEASFDHSRSRFALTGKHVEVQCKACHKDSAFRQTPSACLSCHRKDDRHKGRFGEKCESCHSAKSWKSVSFDHDADTHFELRGKHRALECSTCHKGNLYRDKLESTCIACHRKDDKHKGSLGEKCEGCHLERDWKDTRFDHQRTAFPLLGKHVKVECKACHKGAMFKDTPSRCVGCHRKDDAHKESLGENCGSCHVERSWKETRFDHAKTRFALEGKHSKVECKACHRQPEPKSTPSACNACHAKDDRHKGRLGEKCETCHVAQEWKSTHFDHDRDTHYPLRGKHKATTCESCHSQPMATLKQNSTCFACHAKSDVHKGQEGVQCESCHNETSWKKADFDHAKSRFALVGKHLKVECGKCHTSALFKDTKSECFACHEKADAHKRKFGNKCESCHNARDWKIWDFNHDRSTKFVLDGAHRKVTCYACHKSPMEGSGSSTPTSCVGCHARDDVHDGAYGKQCERCHLSSSFKALRPGVGKLEQPLQRCAPITRMEAPSCDRAARVAVLASAIGALR